MGFRKALIICDSAEPKSIEELRQHGLTRAKESVKGNEEHQETKEERIARLKREWGVEDET